MSLLINGATIRPALQRAGSRGSQSGSKGKNQGRWQARRARNSIPPGAVVGIADHGPVDGVENVTAALAEQDRPSSVRGFEIASTVLAAPYSLSGETVVTIEHMLDPMNFGHEHATDPDAVNG